MRSILRHGSLSQWSGALALSWLAVACWQAQGAMQGESQAWGSIGVDRARLSVDLKQADIRAVLTEIAEKAGIAIAIGPIEHRAISARFTDMELEAGLRRLLQLASLNYTILYTRGDAGTAAIKEVHVFARGKNGEPLQPTVARSDGRERVEQSDLPGVPPPAQPPQAPSSPVGGQGSSEIIQRLQEFSRQLSQGTQGGTPPVSETRDIEALRSLLKGFEKQPE